MMKTLPCYEPEKPKRSINLQTASFRDGYVGTPSYDRRVLRELDAALRGGTYHDELFQKLTGKPVDELWKQFLGELPWSGVAAS